MTSLLCVVFSFDYNGFLLMHFLYLNWRALINFLYILQESNTTQVSLCKVMWLCLIPVKVSVSETKLMENSYVSLNGLHKLLFTFSLSTPLPPRKLHVAVSFMNNSFVFLS